ncbi:unnamed protein product, partial [marine sediment metagenome]
LGEVGRMLWGMLSNRADAERAVECLRSKSDDEVISEWAKLLSSAQSAHVDEVLREMSRSGLLAELEQAECLDESDKLEPYRREVLRLSAELAKATADEQKAELAERLHRAADHRRLGSKRKWAGDGRQRVSNVFGAIKTMLAGVPGGTFERSVSRIDRDSLAFTRCLIRLYDAVAEAYEAEKAENGVLDFDDLLLETRELLSSSEAVRMSVQKRIRYLLVDELQDSALIERDIILLIVRDEEKFARSKEVRILPGKLFVVGDDKQSIYRFRGAEVSVFRELTDRMRG